MKFFDKWFYRKVRWCWTRADQEYPEVKAEQDALDEIAERSGNIRLSEETLKVMVSDSDEGIELERPIRFKVAKAEGGMIVEVNSYDQKNDRRGTTHHLIPSDVDDTAGAIAKIVTIEFLRR